MKHFEFVIRQLEQLKSQDRVPEEEEEKIWELLNKAEDLCMISIPKSMTEDRVEGLLQVQRSIAETLNIYGELHDICNTDH